MPAVPARPASTNRETWALLAAAVLHIAALGTLPEVLGASPLRALHLGLPATMTEIDVVPLPALSDGAPLPNGIGVADPQERAERSRRAPRAGEAEPSGAEPAPDGRDPGATPPSGPGADDYGPVEPEGTGFGPRAGGPPIWALPGAVAGPGRPAPAPTRPDAPRKVDRDIASQILDGTLGSSDRDKGLEVPMGGIIARAFEDGARSMSLPHDCRASFEVVVGERGETLAVRHLSATAGDAALWQRLAAKVNAALAAKRLPTGGRARRGATVSVTVVSRFVYPSGSAEPSMSDAGSNRSDVIHATYSVRAPRERPMPAGSPKPIDTSSPYTKRLPSNVAPVEHKPLDPGR